VRYWTRPLAIFAIAALAACGGGGGSAPPPLAAGSKIFVADSGTASIGSSANSNPAPGVSIIDRVISGPSTMLTSNLTDIALDAANDRLYVSDTRSILAFNNVSTTAGNVAPRVVSTFAAPGNFVGIFLDTVNDRLYASVNISLTTTEVRVFDNVSSAVNASPSRTFTFPANFLFDIAVDTTRNIAYVYDFGNTGFSQISVFDSASTLSGSVTPNRTISIGDSFFSTVALGIFVDPANDRLYAPRSSGAVMVFDHASTKNGAITDTAVPERTITLPVPALTNITVDPTANRLYAVDTAGVNIIANASTANGTPIVVRVLAAGSSVFKAVAVKP
jgi:hypothetical protein